jgi:hypothetical protein
MKIKLDENLPLQIAVELRTRTHDVQTVGEEALSGRADLDIWQASQREGRVRIIPPPRSTPPRRECAFLRNLATPLDRVSFSFLEQDSW